jgi:hypothetical protein
MFMDNPHTCIEKTRSDPGFIYNYTNNTKMIFTEKYTDIVDVHPPTAHSLHFTIKIDVSTVIFSIHVVISV